MAIKKSELEKMNEMLTNGATIAKIHRKFNQYDYLEIYCEVNDYSFLGKKRMVTNRINKIAKSKTPSERQKISKETKILLNELYTQLKINSKKLYKIARTIRE